MENLPCPLQTSEDECDVNLLYSDKSKLRLKDAIIHMEQLLLESNLIAQESSGVVSHEAMQIGEDLYEYTVEMLGDKIFVEMEELILQDSDEDVPYDDSNDSQSMEEEKKTMEYISLDYKIKVVNLAKEHPKWNLKILQKKEVHT